MISASHNSFEDNGIKIFNNKGYKLSDEIESSIENLIDNIHTVKNVVGKEIGTKKVLKTAVNEYVDFIVSKSENKTLNGLKIVIDCANGATSVSAQKTFEKLGANVIAINNSPNGTNINYKCGSTHMENLQKEVIAHKANVGFAFDGDGDRCLCVDEKGKIVDGDEMLSILAVCFKNDGNLKNNTVVGTIMANLGFDIMCKKANIDLVKTNVGDRYVLESMLQNGYILGGEQSGHIIILDYNTTGDGIMTAVKLALILSDSKKEFSKLNVYMKSLPQVLVNAKVSGNKKHEYKSNSEILEKIKILENKYNGNGRVLVRASGTENLVRVMIEGSNVNEIKEDASYLMDSIEKVLS